MRNLYDFSDAQMSWLSCPGFDMDKMIIVDNSNEAAFDDEEDWFFPQPKTQVWEDPRVKFLRESDPALPPIIHIWAIDRFSREFRESVDLTEFESYEQFKWHLQKHLCFDIVDSDNCDFRIASRLMKSEKVFEYLIDQYKARL